MADFGCFSVESLEARIVPASATPITFDPAGTLVTGSGTINGALFVHVSEGKARVFATDLDGDGFLDANEITGVALSDSAKVEIRGSVHGDIVTNLKSGSGELTGETGDGSVLEGSVLGRLAVQGSVFGDILVGKSINALQIQGSVGEVRIGTAAGGQAFQFRGPEGGTVSLEPYVPKTNEIGGSIRKAFLGGGADGLYAGDGGPGGAGGSLSSVRILNDTGGLVLQAGNGGSRDNASGGHGGDLTRIEILSSEGALLLAGSGGDSAKNNSLGGNGGSISSVKINSVGEVQLRAGDGGDNSGRGSTGGAGGTIVKSLYNAAGGEFTAGKGGQGGQLGGDGGSILKLKGALSGVVSLRAGGGGISANEGGNGGTVSGLSFDAGSGSALIRAIVAGNGGDGGVTNGDGGSISKVKWDGDIGDFGSAYGVGGMGGLFAGRAGGVIGAGGENGDVFGIKAARIAAIVADGDPSDPVPSLVRMLKNIRADEIGANFDTDPDNEGVREPALDYFETIGPVDQYNIGERPIDGPVLARTVTGLKAKPLFVFESSVNKQTGRLDPHLPLAGPIGDHE